MKLSELLEAGKVHTVTRHTLSDKPNPEREVADGKFAVAGTRAWGSEKRNPKATPSKYHAAGDSDIIDDNFAVLVMANDFDEPDYYGVNVLFNKNGKVSSSTGDAASERQWKAYKDTITNVARTAGGGRLEDFLKGSR